MADFSGYQLTKKGLALQAKAQSGVVLQYTKISVGDGIVPSGTSIESLTNLISLQMNLSPIAAEAVGEGTARVRGGLSNAELENGFILREIGVFAKDPEEGEILYAYTTAGSSGDPIPAGGGTTAIERVVEAVIIVGQATNIQFQVKSGTYITIEELENYTKLTQFQGHICDFSDHIRINRVRQNSEAIKVGDIRYPGALSAASYLLLECIQAGTTGTVEPTWSAIGSTVTDGTAKWQACDLRDSSVDQTEGRRAVLGANKTVPISQGGTGAAAPLQARTNLGVPPLPTEVQVLNVVAGAQPAAPSGGTWIWFCTIAINTATGLPSSSSIDYHMGVSAGGASIGNPNGGVYRIFHFWKVN